MQQKPALRIEGFWNMRSLHLRDSIDVEFLTLIFSFGSDSTCQVPTRSGQPFSVIDGEWSLDQSGRELLLHVADTLFTGAWRLDNVRYSTVRGFESEILEMDICNKHMCAHIARY